MHGETVKNTDMFHCKDCHRSCISAGLNDIRSWWLNNHSVLKLLIRNLWYFTHNTFFEVDPSFQDSNRMTCSINKLVVLGGDSVNYV